MEKNIGGGTTIMGTDFQINDVVTWAYIPKKTTKNLDDSPEYVRLYNIKSYGRGPFKVLDIIPHQDFGSRLMLIKIIGKDNKAVHINKLAFKKSSIKK